MLLEPRQSGKARRIVGDVAENQPVPGSGLVESPHLLSESGKPMVKLWARLQPERLDRERLDIDRPHLLEGVPVDREQLVSTLELGGLACGLLSAMVARSVASPAWRFSVGLRGG